MRTHPALAYDDRGSGAPVIVLVHGHPFDRRMWAPQLDSLTGDARVLAPDLTGYGSSPPRGSKITMRELADAVLGLLENLSVRRATVVGLSMGGLVAMELGLAHPDRVDGLVLAATTAAPVTGQEAGERRARAGEIEADGMLSTALDMAGKLFGPAARRDPALVETVFRMMIHTPPAGAAAALRGRAERPDYAHLLAGLRVPALVVAGDSDTYSTQAVTKQLMDVLPEAELVWLEGIGHLPNLEAPQRFDAAVHTFVRRVGRADR